MALSFSWCGTHASPSSAARIVARSTADGVLTAVVDGVTYTGTTISTGTADGIGTVDITGLAAGTTYTATLYVGGVFTSIGGVSRARLAAIDVDARLEQG